MAKRDAKKTGARGGSATGSKPARQNEPRETEPLAAWIQCALAGYLVVVFGVLLFALLWLWSGLKPGPAVDQTERHGEPPPVTATAPATEPAQRPLPRLSWAQFEREQPRVLGLVLVLGALGGVSFGMFAFCYHLSIKDFKMEYLWWYILRPALGAGMALVVFLVLRGGFITPQQGPTTFELYSTGALAALCGMFSEQATKKLGQVFKTLFATEADVRREDQQRNT